MDYYLPPWSIPKTRVFCKGGTGGGQRDNWGCYEGSQGFESRQSSYVTTNSLTWRYEVLRFARSFRLDWWKPLAFLRLQGLFLLFCTKSLVFGIDPGGDSTKSFSDQFVLNAFDTIRKKLDQSNQGDWGRAILKSRKFPIWWANSPFFVILRLPRLGKYFNSASGWRDIGSPNLVCSPLVLVNGSPDHVSNPLIGWRRN